MVTCKVHNIAQFFFEVDIITDFEMTCTMGFQTHIATRRRANNRSGASIHRDASRIFEFIQLGDQQEDFTGDLQSVGVQTYKSLPIMGTLIGYVQKYQNISMKQAVTDRGHRGYFALCGRGGYFSFDLDPFCISEDERNCTR